MRLLIEKGATIGKLEWWFGHRLTISPTSCSPLHTYTSTRTRARPSDAINFQGQNALMVAAEFNNANVIEVLLEETEIALEARNVDGETALCIAIHRGHVELVRMLCEVCLRAVADDLRKPPAAYHQPRLITHCT